MDKPTLIFDGDCGFCRLWVNRWKHVTADHVVYAASQEVALQFPEIPPQDFQKAIQFVEPDGTRTSAAKALFRALRHGGHPRWERAYEKVPGFAAVSEWVYGIVAGHRSTFSALTRWVWAGTAAGACSIDGTASYRQVRWIFLRGLALVYGVAFWSFGSQVRGLIGADGILPAHEWLSHLSSYGAARFWYYPTLAWFNSSDQALFALCAAGVVAAVLVFLNVAPRVLLVLSWLLYLSLVSVGGDFMSFQWDGLLLETGFLAIFFAPSGIFPQRSGARPPSGPFVFLLRWLLFRLMVQSAFVKWLSGDPLWHHLTALTVHYQTQPLPNPLSWFAHQAPATIQQICCALMFVIEGLVPFLIFGPRVARMGAFWALVTFQLLIAATGNYAYFNLLTLVLCLLLLDDAFLRRWWPAWCDEPLAESLPHTGGRWKTRGTLVLAGLIFIVTALPFARVMDWRLPRLLMEPAVLLSPLRSFNGYGLFAVMTTTRPEIILEGSNDGDHWVPYEFNFKAGDVSQRPRQIAPFQPRLDWQMWFAALSDYRQNPWFLHFCLRLLQGSKPVLALLKKNPFPESPPKQLRAVVYEYRFTTPDERFRTGVWWVRENKGMYCPLLSLKEKSKTL